MAVINCSFEVQLTRHPCLIPLTHSVHSGHREVPSVSSVQWGCCEIERGECVNNNWWCNILHTLFYEKLIGDHLLYSEHVAFIRGCFKMSKPEMLWASSFALLYCKAEIMNWFVAFGRSNVISCMPKRHFIWILLVIIHLPVCYLYTHTNLRYMCVCVCVCLSVYLSVCLSLYIYIYNIISL